MHTLQLGEFTVHYNGDFSGDIVIRGPIEAIEEGTEVTLPISLLEDIVAEKIRQQRIGKLEEAGTSSLLGLGVVNRT